MSSRSCDIVRPFGAKRCFTLIRQFEVIFVELMGANNTHLERFARGVMEHPQYDSCVEGAPGASAKDGSHAVFHTSILDIWVGRGL